MAYSDLRDFIGQVKDQDRLRVVEGADPYIEIGNITEVAAGLPECPALLFDKIKGVEPGFRILSNVLTTPQRAGLALGLDIKLSPVEMLKAWMARRQNLRRYEPIEVTDAPFLEHSDRDSDVDLGKFPAPVWHRGDGGPYIGTGALVVTKDPDDGWINASIYRLQVHSKDTITVQFDTPARHAAIIAKKYWDLGNPCPVAVVIGADPAFFIAGFESLPTGFSEYEFASSIKDAPIDICRGPLTGLPVPARAEMVLEGDFLPTTLVEGPFGEFTGYYTTEQRACPIIKIKAVHYRDSPIILSSPPMKPPRAHMGLPFRSAAIWTHLKSSGITDVVAVWQHVSSQVIVVALKQRYDGHAQRAGLIAAAHAFMARYVIVVDDDIDPTNLHDVMWAVATRSEPIESIDIIRHGWSSILDPRISPEDKLAGVASHSKAIILACRPFRWLKAFPSSNVLSPEEIRLTEEKWRSVLQS